LTNCCPNFTTGKSLLTIPNCKTPKTTGANYNKMARYKQGEAFTLGYGFAITAIASAKLAMMKKNHYCLSITMVLESKICKNTLDYTVEQAKFIRTIA
jgi:hypothetical protein